MVIQGFDNYIRSKVNELSPGKSQKISLLLPSMMRSLDFEVKSIQHNLGPDFLKIEINISNWFLKIFTDQIEITYNKKLDQQVYYHGITVIRKPTGGNEKYILTYDYSKI